METKPFERQALRVLFLASDPSNTSRLKLGKELQAVRDKLKDNAYFEIQDQLNVKSDDVLSKIKSYKPHIVHFSGHGESSGELYFEDLMGMAKKVSIGALASLFHNASAYVKCVILNTCYSENQAKAISQYIPVVIGTKEEISNDAAILFSSGFYTSLEPELTQDNLEKAFELGRINMSMDGNSENSKLLLISKNPERDFMIMVDESFSELKDPNHICVTTKKLALEIKGKKLGLSYDTVNAIIENKLNNLDSFDVSKNQFEWEYQRLIEEEYPLSNYSEQALKELQDALSLGNDIVKDIKDKFNSKLGTPSDWFNRGQKEFNKQNFEKAISHYLKALEKNNDYSGAYCEIGFCYDKLGNYSAAIKNYNTAIEIDNNWEPSINSLSFAYFSRAFTYYGIIPRSTENVRQALSDWRESIIHNPNDTNAYYNCGLSNQYLENFRDAIDDYKKSLEIDTINDNKTKSQRAENIVFCYNKLDEKDEAKKWEQISADYLNNTTSVNV